MSFDDLNLDAINSPMTSDDGITKLVDLVRTNNEKQEHVIELLIEIMSVCASKSLDEATTKYSNVLGNIETLGTAVEFVQPLIDLLNTVFNSVQPLLTATQSSP